MQIRVKYDGKDYELPDYGPSDFVAFERHFKVSAAALQDEASARFEWICFLVYRGLKRAGALRPDDEVGGFSDDFLDRIDEIDFDSDEEKEGEQQDENAVDPTVPAQPLG